ncbi:MAG: polymer-forming cytoskeletal protein [Deltaproteobacteria bacterium]|jgi:cytoskeletal protein CcmA (bactofilin family)|nr:polymer-forming cytoskeletal protein [Deltaproteobacteria bacterium]
MTKKSSITTLIGPETTFNGELNFEDPVRIEGKLSGKVNSEKAALVVGKGGFVDGEIFVKELINQGRIQGDVKVLGKTTLESSSHFKGKLETKLLEIATGAVFNAECIMESNASKKK